MGAERRSGDDGRRKGDRPRTTKATRLSVFGAGTSVRKVTIIPRGRALGVTTSSCLKGDAIAPAVRSWKAKISTRWPRRCLAEEIIYGVEHVSTGASNDDVQSRD